MTQFAAIIAGGLVTTAALAMPEPIVVTEPLGIPWANQIVTIERPEGWDVLKKPALQGPNGVEPYQVTGDNRLAFHIDQLAPNESRRYEWLESATRQQRGVKASESNGELTIQNGPLTIRFPAASGEEPTPLFSVTLADGSPMVSARFGDAQPKAVERHVLAEGPVYASVQIIATAADGGKLQLTLTVGLDDPAVTFFSEATAGAEALAIEFVCPLSPPGPRLSNVLRTRLGIQSNPLAEIDGEPIAHLNPWPGDGWFPKNPAVIRAASGNAGEIQIAATHAGEWVKPKTDIPWRRFLPWSSEMIGTMWADRNAAQMPLRVESSNLILTLDGKPFHRRFVIAHTPNGDHLIETFRLKAGTAHSPVPRLDEVLQMTLAWPDARASSPLFPMVSPPGPEVAKAARESLETGLQRIGELDLMRLSMDIAGFYDLAMRDPDLDPQTRLRLRAQTARLAYSMAAPLHWSFERGYASGNPNMSVSRTANLGVMALALRDHPMSKFWATYAKDWLSNWLDETVDPSGSWPESSHYARVSVANFVQFALAAQQAGFADFFANPKFQALTEFYSKTVTPPDPLRNSIETGRPARVTAPYGRGTRGDAWGLDGLLAAGWEKSDPKRAAMHQWAWLAAGESRNFSHHTGGQCDRVVSEERPSLVPEWKSEFLPTLGFLWRDHVGQPTEDYLLWVTESPRSVDGEIWPADVGAIAKWFSGGVPIGGSFVRVPETSHPLLINRVSPAAPWVPGDGASFPPSGYHTQSKHESSSSLQGLADYGRVAFSITSIDQGLIKLPADVPPFPPSPKAEPPVNWLRQMIRFRPADAGHDLLIIRDTVTGGQPTQWQFWSLTDGIAPVGNASETAPAGSKILPFRVLPGDRFTATGQFGMDLDTFVASPEPGTAFTMRYGTTGDAYGIKRFSEYQDLLALRLAGDGTYFVALVPRRADSPAPEFVRSKSQTLLGIKQDTSATWVFLSDKPTEAAHDDLHFVGTAGIFEKNSDSQTLVLSSAGSIKSQLEFLAADHPVAFRVTGKSATIDTPEDWPGGRISVAGHWAPASSTKKEPTYRIDTPAGARQISLSMERP